MLTCANHLDRRAALHCPQCDAYLCTECADHAWAGRGFVDQCKACKAMLEPVRRATAQGIEPGAASFVRRLPSFLAYPLRRSVLIMLGGLAVLCAPMFWLGGMGGLMGLGAVLLVIGRGFEIAAYFRMVMATAYGQEDVEAPELRDLHSDVIGPVIRYLVALGPIVLGVVWLAIITGSPLDVLLGATVDTGQLFDHPGPAALVVIGLVLLPLLTVIAANSHSSLEVLDPRIWARAIQSLGLTYVAGAVVFYAVLAVEILALAPLVTWLRQELSIPVVTTLATMMIGYLFMALRARVLGGMVEPYLGELS